MDLTEFMAELRTDLKDGGTVWSDTELTRCINRAVDDLSRFIPRERIYEHTYKNAVTDENFTTAADQDGSSIVNTWDISSIVDSAKATLYTSWHDVPRPCRVALTDANNSVTRMTLIVKGVDQDGVSREERFFRHNGKIQTGKVYFASIYEIEISEINGNGALDIVEVGRATGDGVWIQLANPIYPGSESVTTTDGTTTYVKDTDYEIDYSNGRITLKSGSDMSAATEFHINYTKSRIAVDISSFLPHMFRILEVEYPGDEIPQQFVSWTIYEDMLYIGSQKSGASQKRLTDGSHIIIYYESRQTPPTLVSKGSYPEHLDQIISIGAGGYALLTEALQYEHQAVTDLGTARLALAEIATYLVTNTDFSAKAVLEDITTALHADVITAAKNADAVLSAISSTLGVTETDLNEVYAEQKKFLLEASGYADIQAEKFLEAGDNFLNKVTLGADVARGYREYAEVSVKMSDIAGQVGSNLASLAHAEASSFAAIASSMSAAAQSLAAAASGASVLDSNNRAYVEESAAWVAIARNFAEEATIYISVAESNLILSDRLRQEGNNRLAKFFEMLESRANYRRKTVSVPVRQPA